ncbi:DNA-binding transcriptional LysR family regulator [Chromobacterium alkanivorans]|uniref:LysR family transcriptional regulator n=1 Tax=Chromobacterium TaxID=535 RepID=UPI00069D5985|nr:LysR substrate-binding domain-containing protein [Chromobacterium sp. LK11]MCS3806080.1 DNA-binding transcriptional LysR family regulator [Chromobacterium alkanivorans]MCS3820518.1 DNA-binding transcriptional LysR family regulator [Chromobacterium alkanivorans]MCS3875276.1 DNA-binding transcriptional LysR family regulator [Chromobacterium alkanivorans]
MSLLKQHQLRALAAVADHGSINAAARALCVTQPAITKALRELEAEQGVSLLLRNSWGVTLTDAGQTLLGYARLVIRELERAQQEMSQLRSGRERNLRIGLTPLAGLEILPQAFAAFRKTMPQVRVDFLELDSQQLLDGLRNGQLDFGLGAFAAPPDGAFVKPESLLKSRSGFVVSADSPLRHAASLHQLQDAEWLHSDQSGQYERFICDMFSRQGLPPPERIICCTSNVLICALLTMLDAVVPLSNLALRSTLAAQRFVELPLDVRPPDVNLLLLVREGAILSKAAGWFIACLRAAPQGEKIENGLPGESPFLAQAVQEPHAQADKKIS